MQIVLIDVAGQIEAAEAGIVESFDFRIHLADNGFQFVQILKHAAVGTDFRRNFGRRASVGNQLFPGRHIDAVNIRVAYFRRGGGKKHFCRAGGFCHFDDFPAGGSAHDGVVHQQDVFAFKLAVHRIQLLPHGFFTRRLSGHDEGAADVAVFDEPFAIRFAQICGQLHRAGAAGIGNRHHDVDLAQVQLPFDFFRQFNPHIDARLVNGHAVDNGIRAGKINIFEQAGCKFALTGALAAVQFAVKGDKYGLARRDVALQLESQAVENDGFGSHTPIGFAFIVGLFAQHQRTDAVRVAEGQQAVARNQGHHAVRAAYPAVQFADCVKNMVEFQLMAV